jgi:hypothetical protein
MKFLISLLLIPIILVALFFAGSYFVLSTGEQIEVSWTEEDLISGLEKSKVFIEDLEEINVVTLSQQRFSTKGSNEIEDYFTSEEMSALVSTANINGPINNVNFSFKDNDSGEVSFMLSENFVDFLKEQGVLNISMSSVVYAAEEDYTNSTPKKSSVTEMIVGYISGIVNRSPVYATGKLYRDSDGSVKIEIDSLKVGRAPLPKEAIEKVEIETVRVVNAIVTPENGFSIEELHIKDGKLYYKGTLPAEIYGEKL